MVRLETDKALLLSSFHYAYGMKNKLYDYDREDAACRVGHGALGESDPRHQCPVGVTAVFKDATAVNPALRALV